MVSRDPPSSVIQKKHYLQGSFTSLKSPIYIQLNTMSTEEKPTETPAAEETPKTEAAAKEPKEEESTATFEPIVSYTWTNDTTFIVCFGNSNDFVIWVKE